MRKLRYISCVAVVLAIYGCATPKASRTETQKLVESLTARDAVVVVQLESKKPAKVTIFNCVVERTLYGKKPPDAIVMSFLHFPNCRRMKLGERYLCIIRHGSGTGYSLVRSDMLNAETERSMFNFFWLAESTEAAKLIEEMTQN